MWLQSCRSRYVFSPSKPTIPLCLGRSGLAWACMQLSEDGCLQAPTPLCGLFPNLFGTCILTSSSVCGLPPFYLLVLFIFHYFNSLSSTVNSYASLYCHTDLVSILSLHDASCPFSFCLSPNSQLPLEKVPNGANCPLQFHDHLSGIRTNVRPTISLLSSQ